MPSRILRVLLLLAVACRSKEQPKPPPVATADAASAHAPAVETLAFKLKEANTWNHFFRRGAVAAHLLATSGQAPRIVAAFPAGNAGIGLWFEKPAAPVELEVKGELTAVERKDKMRGVRVVMHSSQPTLRATGMVLSSIRVLRDFASDPKLLPKEITNEVVAGPPLVIKRTTLDGGHHLELIVEPQGEATAKVDDKGALVLAGKGGFDVAFTFLQDDTPLSPIPLAELLTDSAAKSERDRNALSFLVYREKMLAGSWRFLTYFGRDTLLSVRLLMPALKPAAIEGAIGAVLERLDPKGEVAHEEDIGEFAALRAKREGRPPAIEPIYDYKMVDDDFMLAPVVAHYLLETEAGKPRATELFAKKTPSGETYAAALKKNLDYVIDRATPFSRAPQFRSLIALKPDLKVGNWRDSEQGLGGGAYAYDINTALVPAALEAAAKLYPLVCAGEGGCTEKVTLAKRLAAAWRAKAPALFEVTLPVAKAQALLKAYAAEQKIDPKTALAAIDAPLVFTALSLDASGKPIPVMHSDDGFMLLFGEPSDAELQRIAQTVVRPFPAGLMTPIGMVIANPAFVADKKLRATFARDRYHGAVIWSWQQAMMAAGLARQLARKDLAVPTRDKLVAAQTALWSAIKASDEVRVAEHWSWEIKNGTFAIYRFGEGGDAESNAAQLWSTVYLAVQPP